MDRVDLNVLDVVVTAQLLGRAIDRETQQRLASLHPQARPHHGYVFQHLISGPMAIGQIAARLEVTQQAVSKTVAELERLGYVERRADPGDARVRLIALTDAGRQVIEDYRQITRQVHDELVTALGVDRVEDLRALMAASLEAIGAAGAISERRVVPRADETIR
jgi:DNA-binding MarR family transcriptional regulator